MTVESKNEIELNSLKYKIRSIKGDWIDPFPTQYSNKGIDYLNRTDLDSIIFNYTRGIGVENANSDSDLEYCWWTNLITDYPNHYLPPRYAASLTSPTMTSAVTNPLDTDPDVLGFEATNTDDLWQGDISQDNGATRSGTYSGSITCSDGDTKTGTLDLTFYTEYQSKSVTLIGWMKNASGGGSYDMKIGIYDGVDTTYSSVINGSSFTRTSVTHTMNAAATRLQIICWYDNTGGNPSTKSYFDDLEVYVLMDGEIHLIDYNGRQFQTRGNVLSLLNADRDEYETVSDEFLAPIKKPVASLNTGMYLPLGDTHYYNIVNLVEPVTSTWTELIDTDVTLSMGEDVGDYMQIAIAAGASAGDILCTQAITSRDMTKCKYIFLDMESSVTTSSGDIQLLLDETAKCAGGDVKLDIPALTADTRKLCVLDLTDDMTDMNAIISVGIENNVDIGAATLKVWAIYVIERAEFANGADANWFFQHDAKLFKCNTDGTVKYSTDPWDTWTPATWSAAGTITDIADQIENFEVGRDASGNYVPYCGTHSIMKVYDSSTPSWVDTEAVLPNHPNGAKGMTYWNGNIYLTYGLGMKEYNPYSGTFTDVGLNLRDGLPAEYNGEIVKLQGASGGKGMFLLISAYDTSGNSKSGLYFYDGDFKCWWISTSNNEKMYDVIVSPASDGYAVYWDCGGTIYYIDIPRGIQNPDKITQNYWTSGSIYFPWLDMYNRGAQKLAKVLTDYAQSITISETVALKYRINHTNTDLTTGWTTLETLNSTAESGYNEELFGSGAGIAYYSIQFAMDFTKVVAGESPDYTPAQDVNNLQFYYDKRTGSVKKRRWEVEVACSDSYSFPSNQTALEQVTNLESAITSTTDVLFSYHHISSRQYYVAVNCIGFWEETGTDYTAVYTLQLIERG